MKKYLKYDLALFLLVAVGVMAADLPKVPPDIGVRIKNVQLDQARVTTQMLQLQAQYQADQNQIQHDAGELTDLNNEALTAAKVDATKYTVDDEKLEFIAKPEVKK